MLPPLQTSRQFKLGIWLVINNHYLIKLQLSGNTDICTLEIHPFGSQLLVGTVLGRYHHKCRNLIIDSIHPLFPVSYEVVAAIKVVINNDEFQSNLHIHMEKGQKNSPPSILMHCVCVRASVRIPHYLMSIFTCIIQIIDWF